MMGNGESAPWPDVFNEIKAKHDAAYHSIDEAIKFEEQERSSDAIEKYKQGISFIDEALGIQIECPENPDFSWEKARIMIQKMKKTRAEVLTRINSIQVSSEEFVAPAPPPSYEEAMSSLNSSENGANMTYSDLARALQALRVGDKLGPETIIYTHDNVKLYFINPDGTVTSTAEALTLRIGTVEGIIEGNLAFLQVGDWIYPLVPGVSPCFHTQYGAFILPDLFSEIPDSSVGIILPPDVDAEVYNLLEDILHGVISEKPPEIAPRLAVRERRATGISEIISRGLVSGAYYVSKGLVIGAEKAGQLINYGTPKLLHHIEPAAVAKPIPQNLQKGVEVVQDVSSAAASVTGYVAGKVGSATMALGRYLAPHIQKQGTRLLSSQFNMTQQEASDKMNGVLTVAAGAVEGFATVYTGLETSAKILGHNLSDNTVKVVEHKYGHPSGVLAGNTLSTVGNIMIASHNVSHITPKGIAKQSVKATGKAMVQDIREELRPSQNSLYPNLPSQAIPSTSTCASTCNNNTEKK